MDSNSEFSAEKSSAEVDDTNGDEFRLALEALLAKSFPSLQDALKALEAFKLAGSSPMAKNRDVITQKKKLIVYRCQQNDTCGFRLLLYHPFGEEKMFKFKLGQKNVDKHSGHKLVKPARATQVMLDVVQDLMKSAAEDGSKGIELQKKTLIAVSDAFGGEDAFNEIQFGHLRRKLEKEKMSRRGKDLPKTFEMLIRDGEQVVSIDPQSCHPDLLAVLGQLVYIQKKYPGAYINVVYQKHLTYVMVSLPNQRIMGSLYGDFTLWDDIHGVSENGYHLALCTVQGNQKCEIVAWALFDLSNGGNWSRFVHDCAMAFQTTTNAPAREWNVAIADGDGAIHSAVIAEKPKVAMWNCWNHFQKNIKTHHLASASEWSLLHNIMFQLLTLDSVKKISELVRMSSCFVISTNLTFTLGKRSKRFGEFNYQSFSERKGGSYVERSYH